MELNFRIKTITSNLGDEIELDESGVTCVVGANNVGKSRLLRDIKTHLVDTYGEAALVLKNVKLKKTLVSQLGHSRVAKLQESSWDAREDTDAVEWLARNSEGQGTDHQGDYRYAPAGSPNAVIGANEFFRELTYSKLGTNNYPYFLQDNLINMPTLSGQFSTMHGEGELDAGYVSMFARRSEIEDEVSNVFMKVFGEKLVYDRATGYNGLRIGEMQESLNTDGRASAAYTAEMRKLVKLADQGSGMQYFLGSVAALLLGPAQVVLLDEPETYLHPPQARALGKLIGQEAGRLGKQVVVVTHNNDFVIGLLEGSKSVRFVRVTREGSGNRLRQVTTHSIKGIWEKAVLRYSNILSGLFYKQVVICESDADCRFFSAVTENLVDKGELERLVLETLFIPSVGLDGIAQRAKALTELHVEVKVIADFDVLLKKTERLRGIVTSLGGIWSTPIEEDLNLVRSSALTNATYEKAKKTGVASIDGGKPTIALNRLLASLKTIGVNVIPEGEMESFRKDTTQVKERWVDESLDTEFHKTAGPHTNFVKNVFNELTVGEH